jgi:hypothetical protein
MVAATVLDSIQDYGKIINQDLELLDEPILTTSDLNLTLTFTFDTKSTTLCKLSNLSLGPLLLPCT